MQEDLAVAVDRWLKIFLAYTLGDPFDAAAKKTGCVDVQHLSRDEVLRKFKEKGLTSVKEV